MRVGVSCVLAGLLVSRIDAKLAADTVRSLRFELCFAAWLLYLASQVVSAIRWSGLARPLGFDLSLRSYLQSYFIGSFFGLCLPGSIGGDVVKAYRLANDTAGRLLAGGSVLADRLSGLSALLVLALSGAVTRHFEFSTGGALLVGLLGSAGAIVATSVLAWAAGQKVSAAASPASPIGGWARLGVYARQPRLLPQAFGWSLIVQSLNVATVWTLSKAIGLDVPAVALFIAVPLVALAATIPISLQGIGLREGGLALLLAPWGVTAEQGGTLGFLWFLAAAASGLLGGVVYLAARDASRSSIDQTNSSPAVASAARLGATAHHATHKHSASTEGSVS